MKDRTIFAMCQGVSSKRKNFVPDHFADGQLLKSWTTPLIAIGFDIQNVSIAIPIPIVIVMVKIHAQVTCVCPETGIRAIACKNFTDMSC